MHIEFGKEDHMKKLLSLVGIFLIAITLVLCNRTITPTHTVNEVMNALEIGYMQDDSVGHVTQNITLPTISELERSAKISWESDKPSVLSNTGIVSRQIEDTNVTLIVSVTLGSNSSQKLFDLKVIGTILLVNYSVEIYLENLDDEAYTLDSTEYYAEEVGSIVHIDTIKTGFILNNEFSTVADIILSETDIVFKAYYDRIDYTVDFYDGGNFLSSYTLKYQNIVTSISEPTKDEYAFLGWSTSPISETYYSFDQPISENITLYAQWEYSSIYTYEGYYEGADGLTETSLEAFLRTRVTTGFVGISYGDARYILDKTDQDPNNSNNVIVVYLGESVPGAWYCPTTNDCNWNREHVWPQSLLGVSVSNSYIGVGSDLHNLKPADSGENSSRSNDYFDETGVSGSYEPRDEVKGDIARILFYMTIMYDYLDLVNSTNPSLYQMSMLNTLLKWHLQDPVDSFEQHRNDVIYSYQNNRNPFIDHPEFVKKLWVPIKVSYNSSIFLDLQTNSYLIMTNIVSDIQIITKKHY